MTWIGAFYTTVFHIVTCHSIRNWSRVPIPLVLTHSLISTTSAILFRSKYMNVIMNLLESFFFFCQKFYGWLVCILYGMCGGGAWRFKHVLSSVWTYFSQWADSELVHYGLNIAFPNIPLFYVCHFSCVPPTPLTDCRVPLSLLACHSSHLCLALQNTSFYSCWAALKTEAAISPETFVPM